MGLRFLHVLSVVLLLVSGSVRIRAQEEEVLGTVTFGALPAFFTGTLNSLDLQVTAEPGHSIVGYAVFIGGHQAHAKQFPSQSEPHQHTVHIVWDSTDSRFASGSSVQNVVDVTFRLADGSTVAVTRQSQAREVYNRYAVHSDATLSPSSAVESAHELAKVALSFGIAQADVRSSSWTSSGFLQGEPGSIRMATHLQTFAHGVESTPGVLAPPGGGSVNASQVATATQYGQPEQRPATQLALVLACEGLPTTRSAKQCWGARLLLVGLPSAFERCSQLPKGADLQPSFGTDC